MENYNIPDLQLKYKIAGWIERGVRFLKRIMPPFVVVILMITPAFA